MFSPLSLMEIKRFLHDLDTKHAPREMAYAGGGTPSRAPREMAYRLNYLRNTRIPKLRALIAKAPTPWKADKYRREFAAKQVELACLEACLKKGALAPSVATL